MHTVNHVGVGAGIALLSGRPEVALPLALASHYVLDALPHYGISGDEGFTALFKRGRTWPMVVVDVIGTILLLVLLIGQAWYVYAAAFLAVSPDFVWLQRYYGYERFGKKPPKAGPLTQFHQKIQWCERPWGIYIEIPLAILLIVLVARAV